LAVRPWGGVLFRNNEKRSVIYPNVPNKTLGFNPNVPNNIIPVTALFTGFLALHDEG